jgi:hypothetical protein
MRDITIVAMTILLKDFRALWGNYDLCVYHFIFYCHSWLDLSQCWNDSYAKEVHDELDTNNERISKAKGNVGGEISFAGRESREMIILK